MGDIKEFSVWYKQEDGTVYRQTIRATGVNDAAASFDNLPDADRTFLINCGFGPAEFGKAVWSLFLQWEEEKSTLTPDFELGFFHKPLFPGIKFR